MPPKKNTPKTTLTKKATKKATKKTKKKIGPPEKKIDYDQLDKLINLGCTGEECASFFGIDYDTLNKKVKEKYGIPYSEYFKKGNAELKVSLRRAQLRSALGSTKRVRDKNGEIIEEQAIAPNVTMQIWLGKQYLNQSDKAEQTVIQRHFTIETTEEEEEELTPKID